ncbi:flagellar hook assembly protein FlgD [Sphingomonas bacterium]|uniref:flagellar hook assembly protein FlgD n=1 Tax=Sphingomonas bacterium TaxID=1895847 RepID=UPI001575D081|nr:flagellar hook capping FlgD N-terminal domain-containing protein [Sphingomonas bacterium]
MTTASTFDSTLSSLGITNAATANKAVASSASSQTLNQADFLTLMTAQLKNQDPFNPVDNTQMIAQMAQFSSVAGIAQMNTTLTGIATKLGATSTSDAMAYVGKTVLTAGSTAYARASGGVNGKIELAGDATNVDVTIADASGNVLKTLSLGQQAKGTVSYDWDGTTDTGTTAAGPFTITVGARNGGSTVAATGLVWAPVESVALSATGDPTLNVTGIGSVKLADVRSVG